jgi:hypothetical protein
MSAVKERTRDIKDLGVRRELTPPHIDKMKPAKEGERDLWPDTNEPGLFVRVSDKGTKTFILYVRVMGVPSRHSLGRVGQISLAAVRQKTRDWKSAIAKGEHPGHAEKRERQAKIDAAARSKENAFCKVAEAFIAARAFERSIKDVARDLRANLGGIDPVTGKPTGPLAAKPIAELTDDDIWEIVSAKAKDAPIAARNLLALTKRFFRWVILQRKVYGVTVNPARDLSSKEFLKGHVVHRRALDSDEIAALWRATYRLTDATRDKERERIEGYPYGHAYRLLMLAGLRKSEVAEAPWSEFPKAVTRALKQRKVDQRIDWSKFTDDDLTWVISAERMKGKPDKALPHAVPLTPAILDLLEELPMFEGGKFLFSCDSGKTPCDIGGKIKIRLDALMVEELKKIAIERDDDPAAVTLPRWTIHNTRHTIRTNMSAMKVPTEVSEAVLSHVQGGMPGVYDQYKFLDEKREALTQWSDRLQRIVNPPPKNSNVLKMRKKA